MLEVPASRLRRRLPERARRGDGIGGAVLVACARALCLVWIAGAVALQTPGARELREPIQRSEILQRLNRALPPSGPIIRALARFDPFPQIEGPDPGVGPPNPRSRATPRCGRPGGAW